MLIDLAAQAGGDEICGLLLADGEGVAIVPCANRAADPRIAFEIDALALIGALREERNGGQRLIGYYHSHPIGRPEPSETDRQAGAHDGRIWVIIGRGTLRAWRMTETTIFAEVEIVVTG